MLRTKERAIYLFRLSGSERRFVRAVVGRVSGSMSLELTLLTGGRIRRQLMALDGTWHVQRALGDVMRRNEIDYLEK